MFPGSQSKITEENVASATTITVKSDLIRLTGSTQVETILSPLLLSVKGGVVIMVVAVDGAVVLGTSGNILVGVTLTQNRLYVLAYSNIVDKWYIHSVA